MIRSKMQVLITGCYKSGTEYTTHLLDNHPNLAAKDDIICFMRFCYDRYNPIEKEYNYSRLVYDAAHRIRYRTYFKLDAEKILEHCKQAEVVTYALLYDQIASDLFLGGEVHSWADKTQLAWTKIPDFLEMFPKGKAIHIIRDPRNVMASFKKATYCPEPAYMGAVFNCYDSMKSGLAYRDQFDRSRYFLATFEDLLRDAEKMLIRLFDFLELSCDHDLMSQETWVDVKGKPWLHNSQFATEGKPFNKQAAIERWKNNLSEMDIALCESINGGLMDHYGYERSGISVPWNKMIEPVLFDDTLCGYLRKWVVYGQGVEAFPTDPLNPENWGEHNQVKRDSLNKREVATN